MGEFEALLANDRDAEAVPLALGVNVTVKVEDWPAGIVTGNEIPESTKSPLFAPEILADETLTDAPVAESFPVSGELDPSTTLPKLRVVGETANVPAAAAVPVPERAMSSGELLAFDTTDSLPVAAPVMAGVKVTVNVTL